MYTVKLYRKDEARTVEIGPFSSAGDAQWELDRQMASGQYSSGFVDYGPPTSGPQEPSPWFGR
jgi:hypothetical protein